MNYQYKIIRKNKEMASNVGSSSAVLPVFELLSNCCNQYGLMPMVRYVYCVWAWLKPTSPTHMFCVHRCNAMGVLLGQLSQLAIKQET